MPCETRWPAAVRPRVFKRSPTPTRPRHRAAVTSRPADRAWFQSRLSAQTALRRQRGALGEQVGAQRQLRLAGQTYARSAAFVCGPRVTWRQLDYLGETTLIERSGRDRAFSILLACVC